MNSPQINGTLIYSIYSDNDNNFDEVLDEFACENESECLDLSYERNLCNDSSDSSLKDLFYADSSPKNQSKINIPIFNGSTNTVDNFNLLLALFISRFNLSLKCADELLKLIEFILPQPNNLKKQFKNIMNEMEISDSYSKDCLCSCCWNKKNDQNMCDNSECVLSKAEFTVQKDCSLELYIFDINEQINEIINN